MLLGLRDPIRGRPTKQWESCRNEIRNSLGNKTQLGSEKPKLLVAHLKPSKKTEIVINTQQYIQHMIETRCESSPQLGTAETPVKFLPFKTKTQFYAQYGNWRKAHGHDDDNTRASERTFFRVFNDVQKTLGVKVNYSDAKGNFSTCDFCNAATHLMESGKLREDAITFLNEMLYSHIELQGRERDYMETVKVKFKIIKIWQCCESSDRVRNE